MSRLLPVMAAITLFAGIQPSLAVESVVLIDSLDTWRAQGYAPDNYGDTSASANNFVVVDTIPSQSVYALGLGANVNELRQEKNNGIGLFDFRDLSASWSWVRTAEGLGAPSLKLELGAWNAETQTLVYQRTITYEPYYAVNGGQNQVGVTYEGSPSDGNWWWSNAPSGTSAPGISNPQSIQAVYDYIEANPYRTGVLSGSTGSLADNGYQLVAMNIALGVGGTGSGALSAAYFTNFSYSLNGGATTTTYDFTVGPAQTWDGTSTTLSSGENTVINAGTGSVSSLSVGNTTNGATTEVRVEDGATVTVDGGSGTVDVADGGVVRGEGGSIDGNVTASGGGTVTGTMNVTGDVTVGPGGTLAGDVSVDGTTIIQSGGIFAPGFSPVASYSSGGLTLNDGATLQLEVGGLTGATGTYTAPVTGDFDQLFYGDTVVLADGSILEILSYNAFLPELGDAFILIYTDALLTVDPGVILQGGGALAGYSFALDTLSNADFDGGTYNALRVTVTAVPEPSSLGLMAVAGLALVLARRKGCRA